MEAARSMVTTDGALRAGGFTILDERNHLLIRGEGFFSIEQLDDHFGQVASYLAARRARGAPDRALVDLRNAAVQSREAAEQISRMTAEVYRSSDRVALIVGSSLQKVQMRRILAADRFGIFVSELAAREHLSRTP